MNDFKVYWYEVRVVIGSDILQKYLFKSPYLYEVDDRITKRYASGAVAELILVYPYGTSCPAHILNKMKYESTWPSVLSEI